MSAPYLGDYVEDDTVYFKWSSTLGDGSSVNPTGGQVRVYKDNSVSQTTAGVTDTRGFDSLTGLHHVTIATTDSFYTAGTDFSVVLQGATIDGKTVNTAIAHFSIENRYMRGTDGAVTSLSGVALETTSQAIKTTTDKFVFTASAVNAFVTSIDATVQDAFVKKVWDYLETAITMAGSIGLKIKTNLDALVSSRQPSGAVDLNADQSSVTIGTCTVNTDMRGTDGALTDKAGYTLTPAERDAIAAARGVYIVEAGVTVDQSLQLANAANAGKLAGAGTGTITMQDRAGTKNRITATVDGSGNRTAVAVNLD